LMLGDTRPGVRLQPPTLGRDTDALLQALGYAQADIDALRARRVIA